MYPLPLLLPLPLPPDRARAACIAASWASAWIMRIRMVTTWSEYGNIMVTAW